MRGRFFPEVHFARRLLFIFLGSRIVYALLGVRFDATPLGKIQHYIDPLLLRSDLLRSLWNLHSQPPLYNGLIGIVLRLFPGFENLAFAALSVLAGLVATFAIAATAVRLGASPRIAFVAAALFAVSPAAILYENLLFYSLPVAATLAVAGLFLHRFASEGRLRDGAIFFVAAVAVVGMRSLFHLFWMLPLLPLALGARRGVARTVLLFVLPFALGLGLYLKNLELFGFFGSSSWFGMSASRMTVFRIAKPERLHLVDEGKLSAISRIQPFSPVETYEPIVGRVAPTGVPALDAQRTSTGAINFNHVSFPEISRRYAADARRALRERPGAYLRVLVDSFYIFFQPPSDFAPLEGNRDRISWLDRGWDFFVYGQLWRYHLYPTLLRYSPVEHYFSMVASVPFLFLFVFVVVIARAARRAVGVLCCGQSGDRADAVTLLFLVYNIAYVMFVGNLLEVGENNRFRFLVEPAIFVLAAVELGRWLSWPDKSGVVEDVA